MTDKELKKLSRMELLEILVELGNENAELTNRVDILNKQLNSKHIMLEEAGSIAEASLRINGVFEAAQAAASQYVENIKRLNESQETLYKNIENESHKNAEAMLQKTELQCKKRLEETEAECTRLTKQAEEKCLKSKQEADEYWNKVSKKIFDLCKEHEFLKDILNSNMRNNSYEKRTSGNQK